MLMFLGVDAGGTKTVAVLANEKGQIVGYGKAGPGNYQAVGLKTSIEAITSAVRTALASAGTSARPKLAVLGLAGVGRPLDYERLKRALSGLKLFKDTELFITNDAHIALVGAVGQEYGVILIAGTGAIAFGINQSGEQARADGWGYLLGDEGGGYWIGLEALRAALRDYDGRGPSTLLSQYLCQRLEITHPADLVEWAYHNKPSVSTIAALAEIVFTAAAQGDRVAMRILHQAGTALGRTAASVILRLNLVDKAFPFVTLGGLLKGETSVLLLKPVQKLVHSVAPLAQWRSPQFPPELGAIILGFSRRGLLSEMTLANLAKGIKLLEEKEGYEEKI